MKQELIILMARHVRHVHFGQIRIEEGCMNLKKFKKYLEEKDDEFLRNEILTLYLVPFSSCTCSTAKVALFTAQVVKSSFPVFRIFSTTTSSASSANSIPPRSSPTISVISNIRRASSGFSRTLWINKFSSS